MYCFPIKDKVKVLIWLMLRYISSQNKRVPINKKIARQAIFLFYVFL
nr:MAG TPA: hypothetical protein [Myoviridae sp. ctNPX13]